MNGTVDPASRRETAAATCWGPTASSVAIRASMDCIGTDGFSETGAHYAEHTQVQQDLRFPRAWRKEALAAAPEVGRQPPMPGLTPATKTPRANSATPKVIFAIASADGERVFRPPAGSYGSGARQRARRGCVRATRGDC